MSILLSRPLGGQTLKLRDSLGLNYPTIIYIKILIHNHINSFILNKGKE